MADLVLFAAVAILLTVCLMPAVADDPLSGARMEICLNGDWLRHVGSDVGRLPDDGWEVVRVPESHERTAEGSAWFRLDFRIPQQLGREGQRILLRFVRVRHYARVFLNGQQCGENWGQRAPFEVDVTSAARPGKANRLEVWVHSLSPEHAAPGTVIADPQTMYRLCALAGYREAATIAEDVFVVSRPEVHVSDALAMPSVREQSLSARFTVTNGSRDRRDLTLSSRVVLGDGEALVLPDQALAIGPGESRTLTVTAPWPDARPWGYPPYGEPVLYHLETRLNAAGDEPIDRLVTRFGFREVWTEGDQMMLNGKVLRVMGYWVPEASGRTIWTSRMAAAQSAGCNAIHNHPEQKDPAFYETADELGLLIWDANYCGGPLGTTESGDISDALFPEVLSELERQYPLWAKAVANHPSVVILMMTCIYNQEAAVRLGKAYTKADPTRLVHGDSPRVVEPLRLGAYASHFEFEEEGADPLRDIKQSYTTWGFPATTEDGARVPLVNKEIWYKVDWNRLPTPDAVAQATADAIDYLGDKKLPGFILYSQQAFAEEPRLERKISWPSRSGEGQHSETTTTGGLPWNHPGFVNFYDPARPAVRPLPTAEAMREAGARYLGHEVPVAQKRRPEAIITVTRGGKAVPDVYVYAMPIDGTVTAVRGMRTDRDGRAWFALREPGHYRFLCWSGSEWRSADLHAPLQALDLSVGGPGNLLWADLPL